MVYKNLQIVTKDNSFFGYLEIDQSGIIKQIQQGEYHKEAIDCQNTIVMPGFIDSHTHGGYGFAFDQISNKENNLNYANYLKNLIKEGVVAFVGTSVTQSLSNLKKLVQNIKKINQKNGPKMIAWYFEGPFISKTKKGAHEENLIISIKKEFLDFIKKEIEIPIILTVAPEYKDNKKLIKKYQNDFIFALGHSAANFNESVYALRNGIKRITHLYNAMSGFHHHDLGILNALFNKEFQSNLLIEIIADGVHIDNQVLKYTYQNIDINNLSLVSDSLSQKGLSNGDYMLGNMKIEKKGKWFYLKNTKILSGSACPYNYLVKNFYKITNCSLEEIVKVSSYNSARNLNLDSNYGDLIIDKKANIVFLDKKLNYLFSYVDGVKFTK